MKPPRQSHSTHKKPPLRIQPTTLWDYPSQDYGDTHQGRPGYKGATPSYIIWNLLRRYTKEKERVADPFCGSGTTILAAERTGRRAYAIELDPQYVDTAIERWQRMTGQSAVHASGKTFDQMRSERRASVEEGEDQ